MKVKQRDGRGLWFLLALLVVGLAIVAAVAASRRRGGCSAAG